VINDKCNIYKKGEEIMKLQKIGKDKSVALNETGQEICELKNEIEGLRRENILLKEVFKTLLEEYKIVRKENEDLNTKENDLLVLANEAGEEITKLINKERDSNNTINEVGTELIQTKAENEQLKKNEEQCLAIIEVISQSLIEANKTIEKLHNENNDLLSLANETGEEIIELRNVQKDQVKLVNESCQELIESKEALFDAKQQNEAYLSFIVAIGEKFKSIVDENNNLQYEKEDNYKLANEIGKLSNKIEKLRIKFSNMKFLLN